MRKLRWKKQPQETGLRRIGAQPRGYDYHDGEIKYAVVSPLGGGWRQPLIGWYWIAGWGSCIPCKNTCNTPVATPEEAKKQAQKYVQKWLKENQDK
jgi:hypothetical protein